MAQSEKVIISVELRDKGVKAGLDSASKASEQAAKATKKLSNAEKDESYWASKAGEAEALRAVKTNIAKGRAKELAVETIKLTSATKQGKTQTGLNNAILVEAGRAASDFQYGMQGMANNIGQLTTLMGQHIQTQGGFVGSMKELGKSFFGIQGVLIGIQLFISFLPQIEKWIKKNSAGLSVFKDSLSSAANGVSDASSKFETYLSKIQNANTSQEEYKRSVYLLKEEFPDYIDSLDEAGISLDDVKDNTDEASDANDRYRDSLIKMALARAAQTQIEIEASALLQAKIDARDKLEKKGYEDIGDAREKLADKIKLYDSLDSVSALKKRKIIRDEFTAGERQSIQILKSLDKEVDKRKEAVDKLIEFVTVSAKMSKVTALFEDNSLKKKVKQSNKYFKRLFKANKENFKIQGELRTKDFEDTKDSLQRKLELIELLQVDDLKEAQKKGEAIGGLAKGFIDAEIQAEEAKTIKINNELRDRLNNENLSAEERKKIQLKIAANDAALAKKKDKLAEKQFKIDKALSISKALIDTYASAVGVMKDTKGGFFTRLAAAVPTIAFGLAQVASIAKQKFVPSATSAPALDTGGGAAGGGAAVQAPSFNIVGSSNINQLSDAISQAEKTPTRTYVVASDISTAQELDRNIIESASL